LHTEVYQVANAISAHLLPRSRAYHELWVGDELVGGGEPEAEPIYGHTYLPRKFKIGVAVPPSNDVDVFSQDLGYIAITGADGRLAGFNVTVGGGLGMSHNQLETFPRLADVLGFCTPEQAVAVAEHVVTVQRDFGDRTDRKHARLKYTIADRGLDWFRTQVEARLGERLGAPRPWQFSHTGDRYGWVAGEDGRSHFTLFILSGRVKDEPGYRLKTALREIALAHKGDLRLTANQNLIIANVAAADRPRIEALLARHGLASANHASGLRLNALSCVALPTCGLALAESERYLPELVSMLEQEFAAVGLARDAVTLRITGCPNGCGRPFLAEIGLVGKAPGKYNLYLGAAFDGSRMNALYRANVPETELLGLLGPIIRRYAAERTPGEHFGTSRCEQATSRLQVAPRTFTRRRPPAEPQRLSLRLRNVFSAEKKRADRLPLSGPPIAFLLTPKPPPLGGGGRLALDFVIQVRREFHSRTHFSLNFPGKGGAASPVAPTAAATVLPDYAC
jgi:sulfite reductase (NADPH) hemoprotein beta-component